MTRYPIDRLVLTPDDIDLSRSPLAGDLGIETHVLGAFNPGLTRLPNGNLLMMARIAEALRTPVRDGHVHAIRWADGRYVLDAWPLEQVDTADPRKFMVSGNQWKVMARSEEHTSELQSLMRNSYAGFCLKKKKDMK